MCIGARIWSQCSSKMPTCLDIFQQEAAGEATLNHLQGAGNEQHWSDFTNVERSSMQTQGLDFHLLMR